MFNDSIRELVSNDASDSIIRRAAVSNGMNTLFQSGLSKVLKGETTFEEIYRVACAERIHSGPILESALDANLDAKGSCKNLEMPV